MKATSEPARQIAIVGDEPRRGRMETFVLDGGFAVLSGQFDLRDAQLVVLTLSGSSAQQRRRVRMLHDVLSETRVVAVSDLDEPVHVQRLLEAGADGVVIETTAERALVVTLNAVLSGQICAPRSVRDRTTPAVLSTRQKDVMTLVVMGLSNAEIARRLHLSETTVKTHVAGSMRKLGVRSRVEAAQLMLDPNERAGLGVVDAAGFTGPVST